MHSAYRFRVARLGGTDPDSLAATLAAARDSTIWIVPWGRDPSCRPVPWRSDRAWAPIDTLSVSQLRLRERADWYNGEPTFDAFGADHQAYPYGAFFRAGYRGTEGIRLGLGLSAEQYFGLLMALPSSPPRGTGSGDLPIALQRWVETHADLVGKLPASRILAAWRRQP